jgi:hypothetical protein
MNKPILMLFALFFLSCTGGQPRDLAEGRSGQRLYAFEKIDLYEIPVDTPDDKFDRILQNTLSLRMMLMLTAYNDPSLSPLISRLKAGSVLPRIDWYDETDGYAYVWGSISLMEESDGR